MPPNLCAEHFGIAFPDDARLLTETLQLPLFFRSLLFQTRQIGVVVLQSRQALLLPLTVFQYRFQRFAILGFQMV